MSLPPASPLPPRLYLASSSPRRSQLLTQAGIVFERLVVPVDEDARADAYAGPLEQLGEYLAREKALAALDQLRRNGLTGRVLASDTTVLLDGRSLAKPRDLAEAEAMLKRLRGREHVVATGVALVGEDPGHLISATSATRVLMRDYSDAEIAAYVATGDPLDKAGAYSIQHPGFSPVARFVGCHLGVIGLPLCLASAMLRQWPDAAVEGDGVCPWSGGCREPLPPAVAIRRIPLDPLDGSDAP
jgi:septum formation protein